MNSIKKLLQSTVTNELEKTLGGKITPEILNEVQSNLWHRVWTEQGSLILRNLRK